jgi:hypothetical protein
MLKAAAGGAGVAMADLLAAAPGLASGELSVLPFPAASGRTLVLRSRSGPSKAEFVDRLAMWLKLELARDAAQTRRGAGRPGASERFPAGGARKA